MYKFVYKYELSSKLTKRNTTSLLRVHLREQRIRNAWVVGSNPIPGSLCHLSYYEVPYLLANIQKGGYRF